MSDNKTKHVVVKKDSIIFLLEDGKKLIINRNTFKLKKEHFLKLKVSYKNSDHYTLKIKDDKRNMHKLHGICVANTSKGTKRFIQYEDSINFDFLSIGSDIREAKEKLVIHCTLPGWTCEIETDENPRLKGIKDITPKERKTVPAKKDNMEILGLIAL